MIPAVGGGIQAGFAFEKTAEDELVFVADFSGDFGDGGIGG